MDFALERARKLVGGNIPPASSRYAAFASPLELSGAGATGVPACKRQPLQARRHATCQPSPKSHNSGVPFSLNKDLKLLLPSPVGNQPSYKEEWAPFSVHKGR